jgi:hypothetical protein
MRAFVPGTASLAAGVALSIGDYHYPIIANALLAVAAGCYLWLFVTWKPVARFLRPVNPHLCGAREAVSKDSRLLSVKCDRIQVSRLKPRPDDELADQRERDLLYLTGPIYITNHTNEPMNLIPKLRVNIAPGVTAHDIIVRDALPLPIDHGQRSRLNFDMTGSETLPYLGRLIHLPPRTTAPAGYLAFIVEGALFALTKMESNKDLWLAIRQANDARIEFEDRQTGIKRTMNIPGDSLTASSGT